MATDEAPRRWPRPSPWRRLRHAIAVAVGRIRRPGRFSIYRYPRDRALRRLRDARPRRVVDIGAGARLLPATVIRLDLSALGRPDIVGDGAALPFRSGSLDGVWLEAVLEHVPEPESLLAEAARVLGGNGWVYCEVPFLQGEHAAPDDYRRWTRSGLERLFAAWEVEWLEPASGPFSALAYQLRVCLALLTSGRSDLAWRVTFEAIWGYVVWPLKHLDRLVRGHPRATAHAFGWALMARKAERSPP